MLASLAAGLAALALVVAGCGGSDERRGRSARATPPGKVSVNIAGFRFLSEAARVRVGGKVTWANRDKAPHTATADDDQALTFDTRRLDQGETRSQTFSRPGRYTYFCIYHRFMTGAIEVIDP